MSGPYIIVSILDRYWCGELDGMSMPIGFAPGLEVADLFETETGAQEHLDFLCQIKEPGAGYAKVRELTPEELKQRKGIKS